MKLYEVARNTWVKITDEDWLWDDTMFFLRPDGMYSHCLTVEGDGVYMNLNTKVEVMEEQPEMPTRSGYGRGRS